MEQPLNQTMILFSLAEGCVSQGKRRKREEEKKKSQGKENNLGCFSGRGVRCGGREPRAASRASTSTCHLCLDTPWRMWPLSKPGLARGPRWREEKAPDCGQPVPESCLPLCACLHVCAHDSLRAWYVRICVQVRGSVTLALAHQQLTGSITYSWSIGGPRHTVATAIPAHSCQGRLLFFFFVQRLCSLFEAESGLGV